MAQLAADARRGTANRRPILLLGALAIVLLGVGGWASMRLTTASQIQPIGVPVAIPHGQAQVVDIEHVSADQLGASLPDGAHAVRVNVFLTADQDAPMDITGSSFVIEGAGIDGAIEPSRSVPARAQVLAGHVAQVSLVFAVPDESTDLVMVLPGDGRVSAEHRDHPGDQHNDG
jgi:hypothetical protein